MFLSRNNLRISEQATGQSAIWMHTTCCACGCEFESRAGYFVLNLNTEGTLLSKSFMIKDTRKNYLQYNYVAW